MNIELQLVISTILPGHYNVRSNLLCAL